MLGAAGWIWPTNPGGVSGRGGKELYLHHATAG